MIAHLALLTALTIGGQDSKWFDLPLSVNGEVSAKVVEVHADGNHKPLPSVAIQFRSITGDAVVARTKTDAEGRFKLAGVSPAVYTLEAGQSTRVTVRVVAEGEEAETDGNGPVKNVSLDEAVKAKEAKAETVIGVPPTVPAPAATTAVPPPQDIAVGAAPVGSTPVAGCGCEYGMTNYGGCGMGGCGGCGMCGGAGFGDPYAMGYGYGAGGYGGGFGGAGGGFGGGGIGGGAFGGGGAGLAALAALPLAAIAFDNSDGGGRSIPNAPSNFNP